MNIHAPHARPTTSSRRLTPVALTALLLAAILSGTLGGCSSAPATTHSGFLSSYSNLTKISDVRMNYVSANLRNYDAFIVDPVQMRAGNTSDLTAEDRAEVARYFRQSFVQLLQQRGYAIVDHAGTGTARVRIAMTNVHQSTWWMKLHPASNLAGAGRGGAAMEGEVIDSVTGEQLAAVVQSGLGSQFTLGNFSTVADLKSTIDQWSKTAGDRLDELRANNR